MLLRSWPQGLPKHPRDKEHHETGDGEQQPGTVSPCSSAKSPKAMPVLRVCTIWKNPGTTGRTSQSETWRSIQCLDARSSAGWKA